MTIISKGYITQKKSAVIDFTALPKVKMVSWQHCCQQYKVTNVITSRCKQECISITLTLDKSNVVLGIIVSLYNSSRFPFAAILCMIQSGGKN